MKIVVNKTILGEAVVMLSKVISSKNALPILGNILCEVKNNKLTMTASDTEVTIRTEVELMKMDVDGRFCVPADKLNGALAQLSDQPLNIIANTESDMQMRIETVSGSFYFPIDHADEYPMPKLPEYGETVKIDGHMMLDAVKRCTFAMANGELRPIMCGMYFGLHEGWLDIVASDGRALAKSHINAKGVSIEAEQSMILPKKAANLLNKLLTSGDVEVRMSEMYGEIANSPYTLTFRLVDGKYPNYNKVIPDNQLLTAVVPRAFLMNSVRKVAPFTNDSSNMLRLTFEHGKLTLNGDDYDMAIGATDSLDIEYTGDTLAIGVKASTLLAILSHLPGQEVDMMMTDASCAITFEPSEDPDDVEITMLTMPMLID